MFRICQERICLSTYKIVLSSLTEPWPWDVVWCSLPATVVTAELPPLLLPTSCSRRIILLLRNVFDEIIFKFLWTFNIPWSGGLEESILSHHDSLMSNKVLIIFIEHLSKALQYMRNTREVQPNFGFLQQLADLDNNLRKDRYRKYNYKLEEIKYSI